MPVIKNKEIKTEPSILKPEPKFILPAKRGYSKFIILPLALIAFLFAGWYVYAGYSKKADAPDVPVEVPTQEPVKAKSDDRYFLASDNNAAETRVYKYSQGVDTKIGTIKEKYITVLGKFTDPYTYVVASNSGKVYVLDATTAKMELLLENTDPLVMIRQTALSSDKKWLAYALTTEGEKKGSEIWLYNTETKEKKQLVKKTELGMYQGFSILGWRNEDQELIVSSLGGDGGGIWGDIHQVNIVTGKIEVVNPVEEKDKRGFITGQLSPDGEMWLYEYCAIEDKSEVENMGFMQPCTTGAELQAYEFATKTIKKVYQNLRYDNNVKKNSLRTFMSYDWIDNKTIIAAVPGAILSIPWGNPDQTKELVTYDRTDPAKFADNYVSLVSADEKGVVYQRGESWFVFDRETEKITDLNPQARAENISSWLD